MSAVRQFLGRVDDWLLSVRDRLTPGQHWTAAVLMVLTLAVLAFGAPTTTVTVPGEQVAAPLASSQVPASTIDAVTPSPDTLAAVPSAVLVDPSGEPPPPAAPSSDAAPQPPADESPAPLTCAADQGLPMPFVSMVVALLQQAETTVVATAGAALPASLAAAVATQAGCAAGS